ncbi:MAG: TIM barrel protein, partial [Clostridia bacterium]
YVVFHVSDVSPNESISYVFRHTDEAVVQAAAELINRACENRTDGFDFLVENLWWPGLTMTRPEITRALLEEIHLPRAGIMLDVGHFLNTDRSLKSLSEGMCAIRRMLDAHGKLCGRIKGVHLHGGISGAYVEGMLAQRIALTGDYGTRLGACYRHILHIDRHTPFDCAGISELIREIAPRYLTYELITRDRREHAQYLQRQKSAMAE